MSVETFGWILAACAYLTVGAVLALSYGGFMTGQGHGRADVASGMGMMFLFWPLMIVFALLGSLGRRIWRDGVKSGEIADD